jgi:hypothetical protein
VSPLCPPKLQLGTTLLCHSPTLIQPPLAEVHSELCVVTH